MIDFIGKSIIERISMVSVLVWWCAGVMVWRLSTETRSCFCWYFESRVFCSPVSGSVLAIYCDCTKAGPASQRHIHLRHSGCEKREKDAPWVELVASLHRDAFTISFVSSFYVVSLFVVFFSDVETHTWLNKFYHLTSFSLVFVIGSV